MNRRTFLKSIATVCGAAVVCPGELLKPPVKFRPNPAQILWMEGKGNCRIEGEFNSGGILIHRKITFGPAFLGGHFDGVPVFYRRKLPE